VTAVQHTLFEKRFGVNWLKPDRPLKLYWINSESIEVDKYAHIIITIGDFDFPETVLIVDSLVEESEVGGRKIRLPELIMWQKSLNISNCISYKTYKLLPKHVGAPRVGERSTAPAACPGGDRGEPSRARYMETRFR